MAVTATTPGRIYLGAGDLTVATVPVGATLENIVFRLELEQYFPKFNGVLGDVENTGFITRLVPHLVVTFGELIGANLVWAIPGVTLTSGVSSEVISDFIPGCKGTGFDVIWTGTDCDGHTIQITVFRAIATGNLEMEFSDDELTTYTIDFRGTYNPADPTVAPFSIVIDIA
ncbi:hypothetical protein KKH23_05305 [Patescibacteria group bacterium]|nr:hypothetical protein [Patescibacteria group bacterium]